MVSQQSFLLSCCIIGSPLIVKFAVVFTFMHFRVSCIAPSRIVSLLVTTFLLSSPLPDRFAIASPGGAGARVRPSAESGLEATAGADTRGLAYADSQAQTPTIRVVTLDEANRPAGNGRLELKRAGALVGSAVTNEKGEAEFPLSEPGPYEITAAKEEFETLTRSELTVSAGAALEVRFIMVPRIKIGEKIDVTAGATSAAPLEQGASPSTDPHCQQVKESALRAAHAAHTPPRLPR